jgi:hypothetical protein
MKARLAFVLVILSLATLPAEALSCAPPSGTPEDLIRSTGEGGFWDTYDLALVGKVLSVITDEEDESVTYGRTEIEVEVEVLLGSQEASHTFSLTASDPGWLNGYPYVVGTSYFIPISNRGPNGEPNYTFLCDPITEVADPTIVTARLIEVSEAIGLPYALPSVKEVPPPRTPPTDDPPQAEALSPRAIAVGALVIVGGVAIGAGLHRRRS